LTPIDMLVMKFGGTSVGDLEAVCRLIGIVAAARRPERRGPLVVVSALAGVTDRLLAVATGSVAGELEPALADVEALRRRHLSMCRLAEGDRRAALEALVEARCDELREFARALRVVGELSPRSRDAVAATGELLSSRIVAAAFAQAGLEAAWVDARDAMITGDQFTAALPDTGRIAERARERLAPLLARGIAVVGGFVGATPEGVTTTLGRGGSDYSAALFGAALDADEIQIWTDVDGMLTADPRLVPAARLVPALSFDEASELAYFGAKVLHPSTIVPAMARRIPVRILNARAPEGQGTVISAAPAVARAGLAAVACKPGITRVEIASSRMLMAYGFLRRLFEVFERHRTPVDVVTTSEVSVSVTIDDPRRLDEIVEALSAFAQVRCRRDMAIVCAVSEALAVDSTLPAQVLGALAGLPVEMVSMGGSRKNVTFVLPESAAADAMHRLHRSFFEPDGAARVAGGEAAP
jgi:aspartate kinase